MIWKILAIALGTGGTLSALCFAANAKDALHNRSLARASDEEGGHDWADEFWRWAYDASAGAALFFVIAAALWVSAVFAWRAAT